MRLSSVAGKTREEKNERVGRDFEIYATVILETHISNEERLSAFIKNISFVCVCKD